MHVDVVNTVVINRSAADVSQYAADPDNAPRWYENIKSVEWKTARPVQVGSQIDFVAQFLGPRLASPSGFSALLGPLMSSWSEEQTGKT